MKKRMKRLAAMLLLGCMVAGSVPGGLVYAEESAPVSDLAENTGTGDVQEAEDEQIPENDVEEAEDEQASENDVEEAEDDQTSGNNVQEAEDNQTSGNDVQEAENDQISESDVQETDDAEKLQESDGKETDDQNEEAIKEQTSENSIIEKNADAINYVIVESPYLETPGTERIAVSYGDGSENISDATLTVRDDEGQETIWDLSVSADQLYLFTYEYTDESETGTYEVISLNVTDDTGEKAVLLSESGVEANFGVNEEYSGIEELQPLDVETAKSRTADEAADVEATVAEIDPDNVEESTEQIVNALENAEEQTGGAADSSAGISAFAATMGAKAKAAAAKSDDGNIVVALDPGHDSTHAGASSNGLREEVLTLKIANYCKEELEKYAGVTVYMTRTGAACPHPGGSSGSDIGDRVYAAADAGADIYVSLHLNSSTASSVNGSEVIIPNKSWKPQVAEEGEKLAEAILKELKAIGLNMRPDEIYSKDTTINERYPDGSISDYFSVQIYAKERGIPGIIVEHAFITNSGDQNYLNSESGLKKLGVADATGIAKYLGLSKDGWIAPKLKTPIATYKGSEIKWNSIKGAFGYAVYRRTGNENWKMLDTVTSTSYIDTDKLVSGGTYYYTIRAYKGSEKVAMANRYNSKYWTAYDTNGKKVIYISIPSMKETITTDSGIKVTWNVVRDIDGYAVYRKSSLDETWKMIGTTKSTAYVDNVGLKAGSKYYYTVRAYVGEFDIAKKHTYSAEYWSGYAYDGISGFYLQAPELISIKAASSGRVLSWKKVNNMAGYVVYRKTDGEDWKIILTTSANSYTDKEELNSESVYYTVRAYKGDFKTADQNRYKSSYWSHFDIDGLKAVNLDTPVLKACTTGNGGIKVNWTNVNEADGYALYRKNTKSEDWKMIATTESCSYTDKGTMQNGAGYYYTVRAYKGDANAAKNNRYSAEYWSGYDEAGVAGIYYLTPELTGVKASAEGRTISWETVSKVSGYAVYRKTEGTDWVMIGKTTSSKYTDEDVLENGKEYYYTVRAYIGNVSDADAHRYESNYWSYFDTEGVRGNI